MKNLNDNLYRPLHSDTRKEIENGDGNELSNSGNSLPKMQALHSSATIAVNFLEYWRDKNIFDLAYALKLCKKNNKRANNLKFEQKYPVSSDTQTFRIPPNIDAVITNDWKDFEVYAIECKYSEAYRPSKEHGLKHAYFQVPETLWKDIPEIKKLANRISPVDNEFKYLHPAQLIKHILGLKRKYDKRFRLLYLWYDVLGNDGSKHREEIERFADIAKGDGIKFHSISYQEFVINLYNEFYDQHKDYIDYISDRYL